MKNLVVFLIFSCLLVSNYSISQVTITLPVSQDAAIGFHDGAGTGSNNYGGASQNAAFWIDGANGWGFNGNRALIQFDLSQIPAGASIVSAELNLYGLAPYGTLPGHTGTNNSAYLQRVTQSWQEYSVTWNNQPSFTSQNKVILPPASVPGTNYLAINVKPLVIDMINDPANSHGFLLKLVSETVTNALIFASRDYSDPQMHPSLKIIYQSSPTTSINEKTDRLAALNIKMFSGNGCVRIVSETAFDKGIFYLTDITGRIFKKVELDAGTELIVHDIPAGIYFAQLKPGEKEIIVKKIVVN